MSRPTYETEESLAAEQEVAEAVCRVRQCEYRKLAPHHPLDYFLLKEDADPLRKKPSGVAYMEVKVRTVSMAQIAAWGGYMLSANKWERAQSFCKSGGVELILAVRMTDGIYTACWWAPETYPSEWKGRTDRDDPLDEEVVVIIPVTKFKKLVCPPGTLSSPAVQEGPPVNQTDWTMR